jgi:ATP-binding protein involved in chromosome partitioning
MFSFGKKKSSLSSDGVRSALAGVQDPVVHKDLVALNRVKEIAVDGGKVAVTVLFTTPSLTLRQRIEQAIAALDGVKHVEIRIELTVPPDPRLMAGMHIGVKNAIAVASGKGGVGKSTIAANLAVALARMGAAVGLMDGDLYGPNIPMMLGITGQPIAMGGKMVPLSAHGVRVMSMGMLVAAGTPVIWRGPMLDQAIKQFLGDVLWGTLDYLVIDLPPGTGDVQLSLCQAMPLSGALIVTTPQAVALADVVKGIAMFQQVDVPIFGIVENMSYFACPDCGKRHTLFGSGGGRQMAEKFSVPLLGEVPFAEAVRAGGDEGQPVVVRAPDSAASRALIGVTEAVAAQITIQNMAATKKTGPIRTPELKFIG